MCLNATTTKPTTRLKTKTKTKQTLRAATTATSATRATSTTAAATLTRATATSTRNAATRQIECFICNLIQLFILTTTIICTASAIGSGLLLAQAKPSHLPSMESRSSSRRSGRSSSSMDVFSGQPFDDVGLPTDFSSSMLAAAAVSAAEAAAAAVAVATAKIPATVTAATSPAFQFTTQDAASPSSHSNTNTNTNTATTTLRVSYDSNEIDNSYAAAGAAAAGVETDIAFDADADVDADDADDVEGAANDYVIAMEQGQEQGHEHGHNTTNEKNVRAATKAETAAATPAIARTTATATNGRQLMNAKTQDLLSLSQLSSYQQQQQQQQQQQTSTVRTPAAAANVTHNKSASSSKNSISSNGGTFQQIGSQRINGNFEESTMALSNNSQQVLVNGTLVMPTLSTSAGTEKLHVRTSAKKVESRYVLPKQQKTDAPMLNYIFDTHSSANKHHHHDQRYGPHFEDVQRVGQPTNITVQAGSSIHLNCRISLLQDKTVSWVRRSAQNEENGLDLLTVGLHAYTGDKRYKMEFQYPNNWRLKIINVKKDDEATYECQISTHPPRVIQINLHVNAPKVMIVDEYGDPLQEKYYEIDSTLQLSCVVRNVAMSSSVVYWKHSENVLNYDVTRGGVSVKTELMDDGANSTLSIAKIHKADSGNYTCAISEYQNFTIVVHILNGESFAELHHGAAGMIQGTWQHIIGLYIMLMLFRLIASNTVFSNR